MADLTLGKIQAALASATNEVTLAAANINFDFTLVKIEAPKEYQPLSNVLSSTRRRDAEYGPTHVTARRLAALFEGVCQPTPNLQKAYGTRVSEISETAEKSISKPSVNIFGDFVGVDATSIWAAATSSSGAIHVHLLACMLARIWSSTEAISLWDEIIQERRREIAHRFENGEEVPFASLSASRQEISRASLASWDASARAWLQTADRVKARQQKQFSLIVKNINLPVGDQNTPYQSVTHAWKSALETLEKLVFGSPYAITDGTVLVALSAWHLYPDMVVYGGMNSGTEILMSDDLISPGGILSLGLSQNPASLGTSGIYWTMPLGRYKFYGPPIRRTRNLQEDGSRLSFQELLLANLGAILEFWQIPPEKRAASMKLVIKILSLLPPESLAGSNNQWIDAFVQPAMQYLQDEQSASVLVSLGCRRKSFVSAGTVQSGPAYFGLSQLSQVQSVLKDLGSEIKLLRRLAARGRYGGLMVVWPRRRWRIQSPPKARPDCEQWALPLIGNNSNLIPVYGNPVASLNEFVQIQDSFYDLYFGDPSIVAVYVPKIRGPYIRNKNPSSTRDGVKGDDDLVRFTDDDLIWCLQNELISAEVLLEYFETPDVAKRQLARMSSISRLYLSESMRGATISTKVLQRPLSYIETLGNMGPEGVRGSDILLQLLSSNTGTIQTICYLETGQSTLGSLDKKAIGNIIGASIGDSLYVRSELLNDPASPSKESPFTRLTGNVGKPGIALLIPPANLMVRDLDPGAWRTANFAKFDGTATDSFNKTSMHLALTEWSLPIENTEAYGQVDFEASLVEAVISVRDRGVWIGDVQILSSLYRTSLQSGTSTRIIQHQNPCKHAPGLPTGLHLTTIDNWDEVLDCPSGQRCVVRSHGNSVARLAVIAMLHEHHKRIGLIIVCPKNVCWHCMELELKNEGFKRETRRDVVFIQ